MSRMILVVDDESDVASLFRQHLRREIRDGRVAFRFAASGDEALRILEECGPGLDMVIFSDVNMPKMTGLELLAILRQRYPQLRIFIVSAYGTDEMANHVKSLGGQGLISKPVDFPILKDLLLAGG